MMKLQGFLHSETSKTCIMVSETKEQLDLKFSNKLSDSLYQRTQNISKILAPLVKNSRWHS